jgi:pimeloyl-ACP methyl ester carboxylesterase
MPTATLPSKPQAPIAYELSTVSGAHQNAPQITVIFINGLGLPALSWKPVISILQQQGQDSPHQGLQVLTYDRFGQGQTTSRDPSDDIDGKEPGYGHDFLEVTKDLRELLEVLKLINTSGSVIFVAASIGVHIARLYIERYPNEIDGLLILDSNIGNQEFTDLWPNPQAENFDPNTVVTEDCNLAQYQESYIKLGKMFNSDVKSPEGLDRRNLKHLLPSPSAPKLLGPDGKGIWLTVVGHDPETFESQSLKMMGIPKSVNRKYSAP